MRRQPALMAFVFSFGCVAGASAASWQEVAPLPEPRWMHVAACDLDGRVYAYAGYTASVPEARDYGIGKRALDIFDPQVNAWRRGPGVTAVRARNRVTRRLLASNEIGAKPIREWIEWSEYQGGLRHEKPAGAGGRDGLVYWFGEAAPVFFDPKRGVWDQHALPISDNATHSWLPPVPRMIRMSGLTATAPDGKIYLMGGIGHPLHLHERDPRAWHQWPLVDVVEVYDPATNTWEERRPMDRPRQEFAGAFGPDGKLYVFDPKTDRWETGPRLRHARFHHAVAADPSGKIYAVGGIEKHRPFRRRGTASVEVLDTAVPTPQPTPAPPDRV